MSIQEDMATLEGSTWTVVPDPLGTYLLCQSSVLGEVVLPGWQLSPESSHGEMWYVLVYRVRLTYQDHFDVESNAAIPHIQNHPTFIQHLENLLIALMPFVRHPKRRAALQYLKTTGARWR